MRLRLETPVSGQYREVFRQFNRDLLQRLSPPFPRLEILRYEGQEPGDNVHLRLNFLLFQQEWQSVITRRGENMLECFFVDEGRKLPFFLRHWSHRHTVKRLRQGGSLVIDEVEFATPFWLPELAVLPGLWVLMAYRKPIYKRAFKKHGR